MAVHAEIVTKTTAFPKERNQSRPKRNKETLNTIDSIWVKTLKLSQCRSAGFVF